MSDDLNEFLRQAALRRQQRQQQKGGGKAAPQQAPAPQPPRAQPVRTIVPKAISVDIPVAELIEERPSSTVGRLEPSIQTRTVDSNLSYADERMNQRVEDKFKHEISHFKRAVSSGATKPIELSAMSDAAAVVTPQKMARVSSNDLKDQLKNPQTLRLAIIAHEIMKRPYQ